ncbi:MAG: OmpA family protein, partial [Gammaproteobacteria bacterium]|nr:OmpA family protein [Gammaproteobacteria bacterium]
MRTFGLLVSGIFLSTFLSNALAETDGNIYLGFGLSSLALDGDRLPGVPTRSPGHTPKIGNLLLGYQFNNNWAADIGLGTDLSNNVDMNQFSINGYYLFGEKKWRPFVSAGLSSFGVDDAVVDRTEHLQAGLGLSGTIADNLELRLGYQHFFDFGDESYEDGAVTVGVNWHFGKVKTAAALPEAQPESVPEKRVVIDTFEIQVQFNLDESSIQSAFKPQFDDLARVLQENPGVSITVEGHTCSLGSEQYNQSLSERRAAAVKKALIQEYGISAD